MEVTPTPVLIEVLGVIPGLSYFSNFYHRIIGTADPRANSYPNMKSPDPSAALVLGYLIVSLSLGPRLMANRRAPSMTKGLLFLYNFTAININGFLAVALTMEVIKADYKELCQSVEQTEKPTWMMTLLYMFHLSKVFELLDTIFLIWKNNSRQLTFLHLYHHSTIIPATWIGVKFAPGGTTSVIAMINCWVHVFMYVYYQLAAARWSISKKFKKLMTMIQITQFWFTLVVCSCGLWFAKDCSYPSWILWWLFLYMCSFLILFGKFFYKTYKKEKVVERRNGLNNGIDVVMSGENKEVPATIDSGGAFTTHIILNKSNTNGFDSQHRQDLMFPLGKLIADSITLTKGKCREEIRAVASSMSATKESSEIVKPRRCKKRRSARE